MTFDFGGTEEVSADICTQDPMWTTFHNRPHGKNEDSVLVASFRSASLVTPQRISNVNSHHGFSSLKDFQNLMVAVIDDVLDEYESEYEIALRDEPVWKEIKRSFGNLLIPLIKAELSK